MWDNLYATYQLNQNTSRPPNGTESNPWINPTYDRVTTSYKKNKTRTSSYRNRTCVPRCFVDVVVAVVGLRLETSQM